MATFYESLSEKSKPEWIRLSEEKTGKKWEIPTNKAIQDETKIEDLAEIDKLMREVPNPTRRE